MTALALRTDEWWMQFVLVPLTRTEALSGHQLTPASVAALTGLPADEARVLAEAVENGWRPGLPDPCDGGSRAFAAAFEALASPSTDPLVAAAVRFAVEAALLRAQWVVGIPEGMAGMEALLVGRGRMWSAEYRRACELLANVGRCELAGDMLLRWGWGPRGDEAMTDLDELLLAGEGGKQG